MSLRIENMPSPNVLMTSMRSIGYTFQTALADILDNSISAGANEIKIFSPINDQDLYITIIDNGKGMNDFELLNAMKYGSERDNNNLEDLGRFGLGLKSASLSQCRTLIVASKCNNTINAYCWDLDYVIKTKGWGCLKLSNDEINDLPSIDYLKALEQGTMVVWKNFDIAKKKSGGYIRTYLSEEINEAFQHISLVFHRFLNRKNSIKIFINEERIIGIDPFLEDHPKTDSKKPTELKIDDSLIKVQTFILPHQSDLTSNDIEKLGGINSFKNGQGFYIYRNDRLIKWGTRFKLASFSMDKELYKYGRIKVDIPNTLDETREIDIKKQNAVIPKSIVHSLRKSVDSVCVKSKKKTEKRNKITLEKDPTKLWSKSVNSDKKERYFINLESKFIMGFLRNFEDNVQKDIIHLLDAISATIPYNDIYNSMCNNQISINENIEVNDSLVLLGLSEIYRYQKIYKKTIKECFDLLVSVEPFNNSEIKNKILERIDYNG